MRAFPPYIESFTGITNEMVAAAPRFADVARVLGKRGRSSGAPAVFVAHNARFDYSFLRAEFRRVGHPVRGAGAVHREAVAAPVPRACAPQSRCGHGAPGADLQRAASRARRCARAARFLGEACAATAAAALARRGAAVLGAPAAGAAAAGLADELPEGPGRVSLLGEDDALLYVGKSLRCAPRVLAHFAGEGSTARERGWRPRCAASTGSRPRGSSARCCARRNGSGPRSRSTTGARGARRGLHAAIAAALRATACACVRSRLRPWTIWTRRSRAMFRRIPFAEGCAQGARATSRARSGCASRCSGSRTGEGSCFAYQLGEVQGRLRRPGAAHPARHAAATGAVAAEAARPGRFPGASRCASAVPWDLGELHVSTTGYTSAPRATRRNSPRCAARDAQRRIRCRRLPDPGALLRASNPEWSTWLASAPTATSLRVNDNVRYWIATAPVGAASVLAEELAQFGAHDIRERSHDVKFQGTLEVGYRACLWSRTATRVLLSLGRSTPAVEEPVRGRQAHRLARTSCAGRDARLRLQRRQRGHPPHDLRLAAAEGCGLRQLARVDRRAAEHPAGTSRRAAASARRGRHRAGVGRFLRREPASARLPASKAAARR